MISKERARKLRKMIQQASKTLLDEEALEVIELFPVWKENEIYKINERIRYNNVLYKVLQDHTSQNDWTPDIAVSLYVQVVEPGTIPQWKQPTGAHDAYAKGDKVKHNDKTWISNIDANVYEPGVYGWSEE